MYPVRLYIARGLNFCRIYLHPYYFKQAAKALVRLQGCTGSSEPWLLADAINTKKISPMLARMAIYVNLKRAQYCISTTSNRYKVILLLFMPPF